MSVYPLTAGDVGWFGRVKKKEVFAPKRDELEVETKDLEEMTLGELLYVALAEE